MSDELASVIEMPTFLKQALAFWDDSDRMKFIDYMAANPEAGDLIPGTGGVRKVRWGRQGSGKRGGIRVIYYYHSEELPLFLIMAYAKSKKENISAEDKSFLQRVVSSIKTQHERGKS